MALALADSIAKVGWDLQDQAQRYVSWWRSFDRSDQSQLSLFDEGSHTAQANLDQAADLIREKFGSSSIGRASGLLHDVRHAPQPRPSDPANEQSGG